MACILVQMQPRSHIPIFFRTAHARQKLRVLGKFNTSLMVIMRLRMRNLQWIHNGGYRLSFVWL